MKKKIWQKNGFIIFSIVVIALSFSLYPHKSRAVDTTLPTKLKYTVIEDALINGNEDWYVRSAIQNGIMEPVLLGGKWYFQPAAQMSKAEVLCAVYRANNHGYVDCPSYGFDLKSTKATYGWLKDLLGSAENPPVIYGTQDLSLSIRLNPNDNDIVIRTHAAAYITWNKNTTISWKIQQNLKLWDPVSKTHKCDQRLDQTEVHYKDHWGVDKFVSTAKNVYASGSFKCTQINEATPDYNIQEIMVLLDLNYRVFVYKPGIAEDEIIRWGLDFHQLTGLDDDLSTIGIDPNKIVLKGDVFFAASDGKGTMCSPESLKKLIGTEVKVHDNANGLELDKSQVSMGIDGIPEYWFWVNKAKSNQYKIITTKQGFFDKVITFEATTRTHTNILMSPKIAEIHGVVYDEAWTRKGVPNVIIKAQSVNARTDKFGRYSSTLTAESVQSQEIEIIPPEYSGFGKTKKNVWLDCPVVAMDVGVSGEKRVCESPGGKGVEICWYGDKAMNAKLFTKNDIYWSEMADTISQLRVKTNSPVPKRLNIMSTQRPGVWASASLEGYIIFSVDVINNDGGPFSEFVLTTLPHEFGHEYQFFTNDQGIESSFKALLDSGNQLVGTDYDKPTVFKILSPRWGYYTSEYGYSEDVKGYAGKDERELFAETFAVMYRFDTKMHSKIADTSYPSELREYARLVHNVSSNFWPHGNTISLDSLKNYFALK